MVFNAPFNNISVSFVGGENWSNRRKPLTCPQVTDKLYHIMLYRVDLRKNFYRKCNFSRKIKICRKIAFVKKLGLCLRFFVKWATDVPSMKNLKKVKTLKSGVIIFSVQQKKFFIWCLLSFKSIAKNRLIRTNCDKK